jgi:hypothetical protein
MDFNLRGRESGLGFLMYENFRKLLFIFFIYLLTIFSHSTMIDRSSVKKIVLISVLMFIYSTYVQSLYILLIYLTLKHFKLQSLSS